MNRTITLRDVATRADVHPSTASRALNERTRTLVNAVTVARVLKAASDLGYQPNALAQGLKVNRTMTIGMLVPDLTNPLFPPIVRGIEDRLTEAGCTLLLANTDNAEEKERAILEVMARRRVDGLIVATAQREHPMLTRMLRSDYPVVLVNRTADEPPLPSVSGDDHVGIGLAVRHLASLGHRRIAHLAGPRSVSTGLNRHQSFLTWMDGCDLPVDPDLIVFCSWFTQQAGVMGFRALLDRNAAFTAVVAANDLVALGCYDVAADRGIRIPDDVSIVGYNDIPFTDRFAPPLTSVRIPHYDIGVKAAELILAEIEDPGTGGMSLRLPPELRVRGSTAPPAA
ncbi:LacI family DNA-binding transcriptional regulator [Egicoccus sp. AB-alg6-2]|uniref:LacI family DNA-binding transcriptional regulator n=1 Tax=Egicoccus sp. AB-alg6-2 TaxID=3242692 RepID=UPI00359EDBC2